MGSKAKDKMKRTTGEPIKVSDWIIVEDYCATRIIEGSDVNDIANRVAFIEKSPRVRLLPFDNEQDDYKNWAFGPKGDGGSPPHDTKEQYGYDSRSREWCNQSLIKLGYIL